MKIVSFILIIICFGFIQAVAQVNKNQICSMLNIIEEDQRSFPLHNLPAENEKHYIENPKTGQLSVIINRTDQMNDTALFHYLLIDTMNLFDSTCSLENKGFTLHFRAQLPPQKSKRDLNVCFISGHLLKNKQYGVSLFYPRSNRIYVYYFDLKKDTIVFKDFESGVY